VLAEEGSGAEGDGSGRRWLVDPLDGTINYLYGHPMWCVSVALEDAEGGVVGVVSDPLRGETFRAVRGGGAELNGRSIAVRDHDRLATALVATGFGYAPEVRADQAAALPGILPQVRDIRRGGSAALDLAWVASGRLDAYFERGLKPWDWGAGRLLVAEAGGALAELGGDPPGLVAAGPRLLEPLRELVGG
jgi:myo-inositol-1(or 4)-monophosphatase